MGVVAPSFRVCGPPLQDYVPVAPGEGQVRCRAPRAYYPEEVSWCTHFVYDHAFVAIVSLHKDIPLLSECPEARFGLNCLLPVQVKVVGSEVH